MNINSGKHLNQISGAPRKTYLTTKTLWIASLLTLCLVGGLAIAFVQPLIIIGAIGGIIGAMSLIFHPFLGVLGYITFEYGNMAKMIPALGAIHSGKIIIVLTLLIWVIRSKMKGQINFVSDKLNWVMYIWLITAIISTQAAMDLDKSIQGVIDLLKWLIIYIMIINIVDDQPKWRMSMWLLLLLNFKMSQHQIRAYGAGLAASGSFQSHFIREGMGSGSSSFFGNAGDFGVAMCVVVPLAFYLMKAEKNTILKIIGLIFTIFFTVSLVKSGARGSIVGFAVIALIFWLKSSYKLPTAVSIILLAATYWVSAPDVVKNRFIAATEEEKDNTSAHRLLLWKTGINMFLDHPLTGIGINNFHESAGRYYLHGEDRAGALEPHNIFIKAISELGLVGITCVLSAIFLIFLRNRQIRKLLIKHNMKNDFIYNFSHGLDLALVGYITSGSFITVLYYPHLFIIMAFTASLYNITAKRIEQKLDLIEPENKNINTSAKFALSTNSKP
ncbi:MAG: O-antigen ligase family protein [candidate division Zixibacteria bacterium]|nr:O-antigen ligase family protein [candidate division Zixibacteria bacterium]